MGHGQDLLLSWKTAGTSSEISEDIFLNAWFFAEIRCLLTWRPFVFCFFWSFFSQKFCTFSSKDLFLFFSKKKKFRGPFFWESLHLVFLALSIPVLGFKRICPREVGPWPWIFFVFLASKVVTLTPHLTINPLSHRSKLICPKKQLSKLTQLRKRKNKS